MVFLLYRIETRTYRSDRKFTYIVQANISLRSNKVNALEQVLQKSEMLIAQGIVLDHERWDSGSRFIFNNLNDIKPSMVEEATLEPRKAAEQFAKDSGSQVGHIRQATQGLFTIEDTHIPTKNSIRVVTTI